MELSKQNNSEEDMKSKNIEKSGRIKNIVETIDYESTLKFFGKRAEKFNVTNPYSVTMYQDNNPNLVEARNKQELEKLLPMLLLNRQSKVLDVACGIGRWSDAIQSQISEYCGIDFSAELIEIAKRRNQLTNRDFLVGSANEIEAVLKKNAKGVYNRILLIGILMYLNDDDIIDVLTQVEKCCEEASIICIREPIALEERLTLKDFFSEELDDNYNAIYRTRVELMKVFEQCFCNKGFILKQEGFLFSEDNLNNRKETSQYYYIFERERKR